MKWNISVPLMVGLVAAISACVVPHANAGASDTPRAMTRSNGSNFKDMVLAVCLARIYQADGTAAGDAASSSRALVEWTLYDADKGPDEIDRLVEQFLRKDYRNPVGDVPGETSKFSLLKCLDLYHSKEMDGLVKRVVIKPNSKR